MRVRLIPDEKMSHILVLIFCVGISIAGIFYAVDGSKQASDGGRGGAIAVAAAFFSLFVNRSYGKRAFTALTTDKELLQSALRALKDDDIVEMKDNEAVELSRKVSALRKQIEVDVAGQSRQNVYIALSAGIGTLVWGFGDLVAAYLIPK